MTEYSWTWIIGEDDDEGNAWIEISHLGEEMAIIMCRYYEEVKAKHPEWIAQKEADANRIVKALNGSK